MVHENRSYRSGIEAGAIELQELVVAHIVAHSEHGSRTVAILNRRGQGSRSSSTGHR